MVIKKSILFLKNHYYLIIAFSFLNANFNYPGPHEIEISEGELESSNGEDISYTLFKPIESRESPLIILSHGFLRDSNVMSGLAEHYSSWGMTVVTPNLQNSSILLNDPYLDASDLNRLSDSLNESQSVIYAGHSAGGLRSVIAASQDSNTLAVFGLDLVDIEIDNIFIAQNIAEDILVPIWGLLAESSSCNSNANGLDVYNYAQYSNAVRIIESDHCDFELPTDILCTFLCEGINETFTNDQIKSVLLNLSTAFLLWKTELNINGELLWNPESEYYQGLINQGIIEPVLNLSLINNNILSEQFTLFPNYPNPFNPLTHIKYNLFLNDFVKISIYNVNGYLIKKLSSSNQTSGTYTVQWDATNSNGELMPSGSYFFQIEVGKQKKTKKIMLIK